jgi:deazaflavin-dependent oxidoreductase (nitroreductase family)
VTGAPDGLDALADEPFCYLTTTGRRSGDPHTIEIWFAIDRGTVYMMAGGRDRSDWIRNLVADPSVRLRIAAREWDARARVVEPGTEEDARVRPLLRTSTRTRRTTWCPGLAPRSRSRSSSKGRPQTVDASARRRSST